jgi:ketosteroid isomerase-like protein
MERAAINGYRALIILTFGALFSCKSQAQADLEEVLQKMQTQQTAWNKGDIPAFMEYYWKSDSLKFIGSKGVTYGWQKTLDNYLKSYPDKATMGILKFTIVESSQLSSTAIYVIGKWELAKDKPAGGYFTLMWRKINNKWVIVSDHTS